MDDAELTKLAGVELRHWWYAARRSMLKRVVKDLALGVAVDIGAGAGGNTRLLADAGWNVAAIELSETGARLARLRGLSVARADATRLPFGGGQFDLVVSMDLWEHVVSDSSAAAEAFRVLKPGGRLYLAVPSGMDLWSGHDLAVGHVRRYSREELIHLVRGAGFEIDKVESWNVLLRPVVRWHRKRSTALDTQVSDLNPVSPSANFALRCIVELERFLPLKRRPGVTLIVQAHKPGARGVPAQS